MVDVATSNNASSDFTWVAPNTLGLNGQVFNTSPTTYKLRITVGDVGSPNSNMFFLLDTFTVVWADCAYATIDLSNAVIPDAAPTYTLGDPADVQTFVVANI